MAARICSRALPTLRSALVRRVPVQATRTATRTRTGTLNGKVDRFGGVTVDVGEQLFAPDVGEEEFSLVLHDSLQCWKAEGRVAVWLHLSMSHGRLLPAAASQGFAFHHAHGDRATLCLWLGPGPSRLPSFATHQIGVAALRGQRALKTGQKWTKIKDSDSRRSSQCTTWKRAQ